MSDFNQFVQFIDDTWPLYNPALNERVLYKENPVKVEELHNYETVGAETESGEILLYALSRKQGEPSAPFRVLSPIKAESIEEIFGIEDESPRQHKFSGHLDKIPRYTIQEVDGVTGVTVKLKSGAVVTMTSQGEIIKD